MKEYIEREGLLSALGYNPNERCLVMEGSTFDIVLNHPAADVVERKRGEWEIHPKDTFAREHHCEKLRCKHCWHFFYHNYGDSKLYCPNCGADMRGDGK